MSIVSFSKSDVANDDEVIIYQNNFESYLNTVTEIVISFNKDLLEKCMIKGFETLIYLFLYFVRSKSYYTFGMSYRCIG